MASLLLDSSMPKSILGNLYNGRKTSLTLKQMGNVVLRSRALSLSRPLSSPSLSHSKITSSEFFSALLQGIYLDYLFYLCYS